MFSSEMYDNLSSPVSREKDVKLHLTSSVVHCGLHPLFLYAREEYKLEMYEETLLREIRSYGRHKVTVHISTFHEKKTLKLLLLARYH
jgi:hypothetical protein